MLCKKMPRTHIKYEDDFVKLSNSHTNWAKHTAEKERERKE